RALGEGRGSRTLPALEQGLDLVDRAVVALERLGGLVEQARFLRGRRVLAQADQAHAETLGALVPGADEARVVEHEEPRFQTHQCGDGGGGAGGGERWGW